MAVLQKTTTPEQVAEAFVGQLLSEHGKESQARRVAAWAGLIALGIERLTGKTWQAGPAAEFAFDYYDRRFAARFESGPGRRGAVTIMEIPGDGHPIKLATIASLREAEEFYLHGYQTVHEFVSK